MAKKNTQKIIIELREKVGSIEEAGIPIVSSEGQELAEILKQFGFTPSEIKQAIEQVGEGTVEDRLKIALKYLRK